MNQGNIELSQGENIYDVVIVGGGISASYAAYLLRQRSKSLRILMIEAKGRLGGRTETIDLKCSKENKTSRWDIGGQWVTHTQKNITKLLEELNIDTYRQFDDGKKVLESNGKTSVYNSSVPCSSIFSWIDMMLYMKRVDRDVERLNTIYPYADPKLAKYLESQNLKDYLYSKSFTPTVRSIFTSNMRTIYGLELEQLNTLYALLYIKSGGGNVEAITYTEDGCAQDKKVVGGTQQISIKCVEYVSKNSNPNDFALLLNTAVIEINQNEKKVNEPVEIITSNTLNGERHSFKAKKVISSIPPNQYIRVKFTPELPYYKRNLFKFYQVGNFTKYIVTYKTPFWKEKGYSGEGTFDGSVMWLNEERFKNAYKQENLNKQMFNRKIPHICAAAEVFDGTNQDGEPALVGFIAGRGAVEWGDQTKELRQKEIIEDLVRLFGDEARDYVDYIDKDWSNEPYSNGCPSFSIVSSGCMKDFARGTREPFLNVHFCGTETATEWSGYMDGAVQSGERAANEILYSLFGADNSKSIKIDYEKTYYHHRDLIKKFEAEEEKQAKRNEILKSASTTILKYSVLIGASFLFYKKFARNLYKHINLINMSNFQFA